MRQPDGSESDPIRISGADPTTESHERTNERTNEESDQVATKSDGKQRAGHEANPVASGKEILERLLRSRPHGDHEYLSTVNAARRATTRPQFEQETA